MRLHIHGQEIDRQQGRNHFIRKHFTGRIPENLIRLRYRVEAHERAADVCGNKPVTDASADVAIVPAAAAALRGIFRISGIMTRQREIKVVYDVHCHFLDRVILRQKIIFQQTAQKPIVAGELLLVKDRESRFGIDPRVRGRDILCR